MNNTIKKDIEVGKVFGTKDYEQFSLYGWNREIQKNTMNKIDKSVKEHGWRIEPIIVDENLGIIDGQHRFTYAKEHNLPVYYIIVKGLTRDDCQSMNSVRASWKQTDYIRFYAVQGNPNYIRLMKLYAEYKDFTFGTIIYAIKGKLQGETSNAQIVEGSAICTKENYEKAVILLDYLSKIDYYLKQIKGRRTQLCNAIIFCIEQEGTDRERLAKKIKENCNNINPPADMETALAELERIYNYKLQKQNQIYFVTEWKKG